METSDYPPFFIPLEEFKSYYVVWKQFSENEE